LPFQSQRKTSPEKGIASVREVYGTNQQNNGDEVSRLLINCPGHQIPLKHWPIQHIFQPIRQQGVFVSCGNTETTYKDGVKALAHGATLLTHLYNAMNPFNPKEPGLVGLLSLKAKLGELALNRPPFQ